MAWTEERVEMLKQLWTDGLSASQIARKWAALPAMPLLARFTGGLSGARHRRG
ncbi:MAG: hypothetical protein CM15mP21_5550 [Hyphomicrobiales bacterium]|nr:MAG: hypothetical protein CM15mP21_5550 [Hyphomicrobiales bacterium]